MAHAARRSRDNFRIPALTDPPSSLNWISATLQHDLDVVGEFGPQLDAASTAHRMDCLSAGCQRFWRCHRWDGWLPEGQPAGSDETAGRPVLLCRIFQAVPIGELNDRAARIGHRSHRAARGNKKGAPQVFLIKHGDFEGAWIGESTVPCTKDASLDVQLLLSGVLKPCIKKQACNGRTALVAWR